MGLRRGVGLVLGLILFATLVSMAFLVLVVALTGREPTVPSNVALVQPISGDIQETMPVDVFELVRANRPRTVRDIVENLRKAKVDKRVTGVLITPANLTTPFWAKLQEIRDAILEFRQSGKQAIAYLEDGLEREYYLASACDRIFLMPTSTLHLNGLASYELFLRGTLDWIGLYPDLLAVGRYKSAVNLYTERGFTPAHREMSESLTRDLYDQLVRGIAQGRKKSEADVRALLDEGPFLARDAVAAGLIDDVAYEDQLDDKVQLGGHGATRLEADDYHRVSPSSVGLNRGPKIAVIQAIGIINTGRSGWSPTDGHILGSETIIEHVKQARADRSVRAIVLRIDSPGGSATASDAIWRELFITGKGKSAKPLVASMSDLAASGGYYIAMAASDIVAEPATLTGSIGIYGGKFVTGGVFNKLGANIDGVSEGKGADMHSPTRRYTTDEREKLTGHMQFYYDQWIEKIAESRGLTPQRVDEIAQGRVWTGQQAKQIGLVDELGGLGRAVALAKSRAGIKPEQDVELVVFPPRRSVYDLLFEGFRSAVGTERAIPWLGWSERRAMDAVTAPMRLFRHGEILALMPQAFVRR